MINRRRKRTYREMMRDYDEAILHAPVEECEKQLSALYKTLDQTAAKGTMHKNTANRYKSRLAARLAKKHAGDHATPAKKTKAAAKTDNAEAPAPQADAAE